jgi:hypothetical protein
MTMGKLILMTAVLVAACGGNKPATVDEGHGPTIGAGGEMHDDRVGNEGNMISPDKMDEIKRLLDRKQNIVSHCLAIAVDNKELPKNTHGKVTVEFTIGTDGHSTGHKIIEKTLESASLESCVIGHVKDIEFPQIKHSIQYSYAYAFEAM